MRDELRSPASARAALEKLLAPARADGRGQLLEHEALAVTTLLGVRVPHHVVVPDARAAAALDLSAFPGPRVVVKVLSAEIAHKTELGGVAVVAREGAALADAVAAMAARLRDLPVAGFLVCEHVPHDTEAGGELLLGLRWSREFGPLVTLGLGGVTAERLAAAMTPDEQPAIFAPSLGGDLDRALDERALASLATGRLRGRQGRASVQDVAGLVRRALELASWAVPDPLLELECNPIAFSGGEPFALDALVRLGTAPAAATPPRPLDRVQRLLHPRSMAVMGVSARAENPGRIVVRNTLAAGFPQEAMTIVKPGERQIDGVACVPDLRSLPGPVDLLVLAVPAADVPAVLEEVVAGHRAEGIVIVTSGIGERGGSGALEQRMRATLRACRQRADWTGPVVNGPNCLGYRSLAGKVDTLFIPHRKLPVSTAAPAPLALISQSGAFAIARLSRRPSLAPRAVITVGNQLDLTVADWLEALAGDPQLRAFACYVEGFPQGEGLRFARLAAQLSAQGRLVIVYRAGRTREGAAASASHTASLAGDPAATRSLLAAAGALVAESIDEFEDLLMLAAALAGRTVDGPRCGVVSNAGFECVAIADSLGSLRLADLAAATRARIAAAFAAARIDAFIDVNHPLDLTPLCADAPFVAAVEAVLADPAVQVGLVGCVPLTQALATLPDDVDRAGGIAERLADLWNRTTKAWVAVVDSGELYGAFAAQLARAGVPVFRSADRAARLLGRYAGWRLRATRTSREPHPPD